MAIQGHLWDGWLIPTIYAVALLFVCYWIIELLNRKKSDHPAKPAAWGQIVKFAVIWILTFVVIVYAYPRIEVYANIWNDYLIP